MIDMSRTMLYNIDNLNKESERIAYQTSTGRITNKGSDDSIIHAQVINLEDKLRTTEGLSLQLNRTQALNETSDTNIKETKNALDKIKVDLMKGLNDGMDRSDKLALATNLEGLRDTIYDAINVQVDGEYLFAGSNSTTQSLQKSEQFELDGRIEYGGDAFLRQIAVQPGTYRDRGVTAYDISHYTSSKGVKDAGSDTLLEDFSFEDRERIIDENGYEWKIVLADTNQVRDPSNESQDKLVFEIDETDPLNIEYTGYKPGSLVLQQYDHQGNMIDYVKNPESRITIDKVDWQTEADADELQDSVREKYVIDKFNSGIATQPDSRVFEAKHSYFDDINKTINALEGHVTKLDGTKGGEIATDFESEEFIDELVRNGLEDTTLQFNAANVGHGKLGGRNNVFDSALEKLAIQETHYNIMIQTTDGADLTKLAMESKSLELTYQALYTTISKMNNLSLLNYMN